MPESSAWSQLSADTAQILFCDLQKEMVKHSKTTSPRALTSAADALLGLARLFSLPTIVSVVPEGNKGPDVIAGLSETAGFARQMTRTSASLFFDAPTNDAIARTGRRIVIVSGFMMEGVVLSTALDARAAGYEVVIPIDACGGMSQRTEQAVVRQMEAGGAVITSVTSIGAKMSPDFSTEIGKRMFEIVQGILAD
jgi:nicotinamidase-related amidase